GAPVPSLPSSTGVMRSRPPSIVVVCAQVPGPCVSRLGALGSGLQWSGGCTSAKYVAGERLLISTKPSAAVLQTPPQSGLLSWSTVTALPVCSFSPTWKPPSPWVADASSVSGAPFVQALSSNTKILSLPSGSG